MKHGLIRRALGLQGVARVRALQRLRLTEAQAIAIVAPEVEGLPVREVKTEEVEKPKRSIFKRKKD